MNLEVIDLPGLALRHFVVELPAPLGELESPDWLVALLRPTPKAGAEASDPEIAVAAPENLRGIVRDLLRGHGYRPTGRGKPSAEYLVAAATAGRLGSINLAVDLGNAVSLHSGLPISVVDLDRAAGPLRIDLPAAGTKYVFNQGGQEIDVGGLLSLFDAAGPCANAVKDAQRTKTDATTRRLLAIVWGAVEPPGHADAVAGWLRRLCVRAGAEVE
ncbi:MAG: phenylalanine--tRNA ligase beta subunit-related protein [bacterium]|nr:phenylalanine--tRNA ligase beta subunit-related protein [bacterium]